VTVTILDAYQGKRRRRRKKGDCHHFRGRYPFSSTWAFAAFPQKGDSHRFGALTKGNGEDVEKKVTVTIFGAVTLFLAPGLSPPSLKNSDCHRFKTLTKGNGESVEKKVTVTVWGAYQGKRRKCRKKGDCHRLGRLPRKTAKV